MKRFVKILLLGVLVFSFVSCNDSNNTSANPNDLTAEVEISNTEEVIEQISVEDYCLENSAAVIVNEDKSFEQLEYLDLELDKNEIFLTGEFHRVKANTELQIAFLKYFKENADVKYYLCEMPYSVSYYINQYLEAGDEVILEHLYEQLYDTSTQEAYNHWLDVYEYNSTLANDNRIKVIGIDLEQEEVIAYRFLVDILPDKDVPEEIKDSIDLIQSTNELLEASFQNKYKARDNAGILIDDLNNSYSIYESYFGEDMFQYELVLNSLVKYNEAKKHFGDYVEWNNVRDEGIYVNFVKLDKKLEDGKYYGQWGLNHIYQSKQQDIAWFGSYFKEEESKYKGKVLSIAFNYTNCEQLSERNTEPTSFEAVYPFLLDVKELYSKKYTIVKINSDESNELFFPLPDIESGKVKVKDANDFFQYVLLIKDSEAAHR